MEKPSNPKDIFIDNFLELLKYNPVSKITVTDLINNSGLSRQTFYRYFENIDDLIYSIHTKYISISLELCDKISIYDTLSKLYLDLMMEHQSFYKKIISLDCKNSFTHLYIKKTKENYIEYIFKDTENTITNDPELMLLLDFYTFGTCCLIFKWLKSENPCSSEVMAKVIYESIPDKLNKFIE
ncbi:TetR/AcrR family transcriptional regulator [Miniphocaeibacter massiliensis]|uniref:TetR/AcrR family transcriptional regulator n=1 Tax=Miniphocaeibacter massiliensis TaxID=2041841 RepID=UPI000C1BC808|nr:TetR/AcrR family transcriptional regulator [Miniphocaeibacter massiliensis]